MHAPKELYHHRDQYGEEAIKKTGFYLYELVKNVLHNN